MISSRQQRRHRRGVAAAALLALALSAPVLADGWTSDFIITNLYVSVPDNFQYRLYGMPTVASCVNGPNWAYINQDDPGAAWYAAVILAAYHAGRPIRLNLQTVNGFCHIIEMFES